MRVRSKTSIDGRDVGRGIRRRVRPGLRDHGFDVFTARTAWRHLDHSVDVVNFQSFGASVADAVGCTTFSFSVNLGVSIPADVAPRLTPAAKGRPRPQEWECGRRLHLKKGLSQPWFEPFARADTNRWPSALRRHREGLQQVLRRDRHDRPEIWFVLRDGSNLDEVTDDALRALNADGLPWLEETRRLLVG